MWFFEGAYPTDVYVLLWAINIIIILAGVFLLLFIVNLILSGVCSRWAARHSKAIAQLEEIKKGYTFYDVPKMDMEHSYDNEDYYNTVTPWDYLAYELVYRQKDALAAISAANHNLTAIEELKKEAEEKCEFGVFDAEPPKGLKKLALKQEKSNFNKRLPRPTTDFKIKVVLYLTYLNGNERDSQRARFDQKIILDTIQRIRRKRGTFYEDREVYEAITRVERAKVSNKLRFYIFDRDGNRCLKCGSTRNLEIDHIVPIAKGGKTRKDNLQTLCHRCNAEKGIRVIDYRRKR